MTFGLLFVFGVVVATLALFAGVVWLAERKADAENRSDQSEEALRRLRAAIEADANARERLARGELRHDDGHRRD